MAKFFQNAFWLSVAASITKTANKINQNPRLTRIFILVVLNAVGFFCFWVVVYGLALKLVPSSDHSDYPIMLFGARFLSLVLSVLLSLGLYNLVRGIVAAGKFVSDKIADVNKGFKESGTVAIQVPQKAVDATKRAVAETTEWVKHTSAEISKTVETGIKKGSEVAKEKAPAVRQTIFTAAEKTKIVLKDAAQKTAEWSKENVPKAVHATQVFIAKTHLKIKSAFKKKDDEPKQLS